MPDHDAPLRMAALWWRKAAEDLDVAHRTQDLPFASCFHSQQAAEKAIKTLLILRQVEAPKTHDIGQLLALLQNSGFAELPESAHALPQLTVYAVEMRYPPAEATIEEAKVAFELAEQFLLWVRAQLPKDI